MRTFQPRGFCHDPGHAVHPVRGPGLDAPLQHRPTQEVLVAVQDPTKAKRQARRHRWGLIPSWAKDLAIGNQLINAQAETAGIKPAYRPAFKMRRCLIQADRFYE